MSAIATAARSAVRGTHIITTSSLRRRKLRRHDLVLVAQGIDRAERELARTGVSVLPPVHGRDRDRELAGELFLRELELLPEILDVDSLLHARPPAAAARSLAIAAPSPSSSRSSCIAVRNSSSARAASRCASSAALCASHAARDAASLFSPSRAIRKVSVSALVARRRTSSSCSSVTPTSTALASLLILSTSLPHALPGAPAEAPQGGRELLGARVDLVFGPVPVEHVEHLVNLHLEAIGAREILVDQDDVLGLNRNAIFVIAKLAVLAVFRHARRRVVDVLDRPSLAIQEDVRRHGATPRAASTTRRQRSGAPDARSRSGRRYAPAPIGG